MENDDQAADDKASGGLALVPDGGGADDLPPVDIDAGFGAAFAQHCRIAGGKTSGADLVSLTAADLAALAADMYYAGYAAALRDLGFA